MQDQFLTSDISDGYTTYNDLYRPQKLLPKRVSIAYHALLFVCGGKALRMNEALLIHWKTLVANKL